MNNDRKETTKHVLVFRFQLVRQVGLEVKEHVELDVSFNFGRPGLARRKVAAAAEVVVAVAAEQLAHFGRPARAARGRCECRPIAAAVAVPKALEVQRQNGRNARQARLLRGATDLAARVALVARVEGLGLRKALKGGLHVRQGGTTGGWNGRRVPGVVVVVLGKRGWKRRLLVVLMRQRDFEAHVFNRIECRTRGLAGLANDV